MRYSLLIILREIKVNIKIQFMNHLRLLAFALTLPILFFSCGGSAPEELSTSEGNQVDTIEVEEFKAESTALAEIKMEIDALLNHLENDIHLEKTNLENLKKFYPVNKGDQYGFYRVEKSFSNSAIELKMTFSIEDKRLNYITFQSIEYPEEIKDFLISKLGEGKIISDEVPEHLEWYKEDYNIVYWDEKSGWTIDIEPKDYYPGF